MINIPQVLSYNLSMNIRYTSARLSMMVYLIRSINIYGTLGQRHIYSELQYGDRMQVPYLFIDVMY